MTTLSARIKSTNPLDLPEDDEETEQVSAAETEEAATAEKAPGPVEEASDGFINVGSRLEVPGVIVDPYTGKTWAVPTDALETVRIHDSPYDIKKDPQFHYQAHSFGEVADMESQGFVKVTRKEVGREESIKLSGDVASPLDQYYTINGEQVMMKIPKILADRRYAAQKKLCDAAVAKTERPERELDTSPNELPTVREQIGTGAPKI